MAEKCISSPLLKARRNQGLVTKRRLRTFLLFAPFVLLLVFFCFVRELFRSVQSLVVPKISDSRYVTSEPAFWPSYSPHPWSPISQGTHKSTQPSFQSLELPELRMVKSIPTRSLTALLPVTLQSLPKLEATISSFLESPAQLHEIIISCPEDIVSNMRIIVRNALSAVETRNHLEISLHPWSHDVDSDAAVMRVASEATTDWILFLDESGLEGIDVSTQTMLLNPLAIPFPTGPRGAIFLSTNISCLTPSEIPQSASFLIPPFVMPYSLLPNQAAATGTPGIWSNLGGLISLGSLDGIGGVVMGSEMSSDWCSVAQAKLQDYTAFAPKLQFTSGMAHSDVTSENSHNTSLNLQTSRDRRKSSFALLFPSLHDIRLFSPVVCRLQGDEHDIHALIYLDEDYVDDPFDEEGNIASGGCRLNYDTISLDDVLTLPSSTKSFVSDWLDTLDQLPDIVIAVKEQESILDVTRALVRSQSVQPSLVLIPYADLPYCEWMGSLSVDEWRNWNIPHIDISVITQDRPHSLERLLSSLTSARFFGDTLNLRINLEQTSDAETIQLVERFSWDHGTTVVNHRVIRGGLLPAVVESWYPHSNNSYGLLLEDDVELSPLFYAWIKMTILRYRYGEATNKSPQLFGISLYQQKNIELKPEGRRPFDAQALFSEHGLNHTHTPYLSQIPCSWGALYFPEHWREFHDYLAVRLSEYAFTIDQEIVPDVRSNRWTKSWKKYFIELVYLRGYAMLYPNYEDFVSFSTNHLEVGSHVKDRPKDVYLQKKDLFLLPLMTLPNDTNSAILHRGLLDLPGETLPAWHSLPVLNLTGFLTSFEMLIDQGLTRRTELTKCPQSPQHGHDVRDLLCINDSISS